MNYYYCYNIKEGLFDTETQYAKELGRYLFYDEYSDIFLDANNNVVDIKNKPIFPRSGLLQIKKLIRAVIRHGGNSLAKEEDYDLTLNWPHYINTKRKNIILSGQDILDNPQLIISLFKEEQIFFKTKLKNFSRIINVSELLQPQSLYYKAINEHKDDDFILSDAVEIVKDKSGPLEYRAFVVNHQILNISRISDCLLCQIPESVLTVLTETINSLKQTDFPSSYVIDIFTYQDKYGSEITDVLECNPITASGTYLYNSVLEKQVDILHKCPSTSIPKEKIKYAKNHTDYSYIDTREGTPSIFYNLPGGFAADLTAFSIFGTKSMGGFFVHFDGLEVNIPDLNPENEEPLLEQEKSKSLSRIRNKTVR